VPVRRVLVASVLVLALGSGSMVTAGASVPSGREASYCPRIEKAFDTMLELVDDPLGYQDVFKKAAKRFAKAAKAAGEDLRSEVKAVAKYLRAVSKLGVTELGDIEPLAEDVNDPYQAVLADAQQVCGLEVTNVPFTPGD
jgi:hypothetical protein